MQDSVDAISRVDYTQYIRVRGVVSVWLVVLGCLSLIFQFVCLNHLGVIHTHTGFSVENVLVLSVSHLESE